VISPLSRFRRQLSGLCLFIWVHALDASPMSEHLSVTLKEGRVFPTSE
jgi:hypothetical protein